MRSGRTDQNLHTGSAPQPEDLRLALTVQFNAHAQLARDEPGNSAGTGLPLAAFPRIANADEWDRTAGLSPLQDRNSSSLGWPYVTAGAPRRAVRPGSATGHPGKAALHQPSHV